MSSNILPKLIRIVTAVPDGKYCQMPYAAEAQGALADRLIDIFVNGPASIKEPA